MRCRVLELEPPRLLRINWAGGPALGTVTWRLSAEASGTHLFLNHEGFDPADPQQQAVRRLLGGGWRGHLVSRLEETVARLA